MDESRPTFSIVTPVYNPPLDILRSTIASVRAQAFRDWELILVDDRSPDDAVREVLRAEAATDPRIRVIERETNGHIVAASNDGIEAARGEFIALLDHDDLLVPQALRVVRRAIEQYPDADYLYSDEEIVDADGARLGQFHKPVWSPERLRGQMYTGHLSVLRTSVVREVGGFREGFDGSQDHDLVLRVTERARVIVHVPRVLYHWRGAPGSVVHDPEAKPYAWEAGRRAVQEHLDRVGIAATAELGRTRHSMRLQRRLDPEVTISVVIPTRGSQGLVWGKRRTFVVDAIRSMRERGGHQRVEFVVVYDEDTDPDRLDEVRAVGGPDVNLVPYRPPFNFSAKCNVGVAASYGDVIVLLNDDVEIASDGFLVDLVAPLYEEGVGATGARLLFSDSTIQHAGVVVFDGGPGHAMYKMRGTTPGPFSALVLNREVSAVTGACIALKRSTYERIGGMSEQFPLSYNDVDFCNKITAAGLRILWIASATAYHFESKSRDPEVRPWEKQLLAERWIPPLQDLYLPTYRRNGRSEIGVARGSAPRGHDAAGRPVAPRGDQA
ncbi:glycosyltransferase [Nocardioides sp. MAH-18]|uniref:Glycosyltransferase n=1 Tax=Nocardioides agri TaxID=2682843 RepID=A0A6L6XTB9_9ACTN|nr:MULTISPECIES: glycosyltransferase [unclassified Nocardioides]MBA2955579.1 glycosyltransferase [Nocardioides sp. CGMCC 1.13656]MVQ50429.1 glycosyltransferase [Nocardioides sp. MAH-18]